MSPSSLPMPSAAPLTDDRGVLFETSHGSVRCVEDGRLRLHFGGLSWTLSPQDVEDVYASVHALAGDVYRCGARCRWQLRVPGQSVVVLTTNEVLRLDTLLEGATVMSELTTLLHTAGIEGADT